MVEQKRVIVLGSSRGIGYACATLMQAVGNEVTGVARTVAACATFRQVALDLSQPDVESKLEHVFAECKPDTLVFCVGENISDTITNVDTVKTLRAFETNVLSALVPIRLFVEKCEGAGSIVLTSSVHARGRHNRLSYSLTKAALEAVMHSTADELVRRGIRINCVRPGPTETEMLSTAFPPGSEQRMKYLKELPSGRFSSTDEIASAIQFLTSDVSANITGQTITVSGGF